MVNDDGFIVRTAAEGIDGEDIQREEGTSTALGRDTDRRKKGGAPRLVYADADLVMRATRDLFNDRVDAIHVDKADDFLFRIREFVKGFEPGRESGVELYDRPEPIFDHFGVEVEIERALGVRFGLKAVVTLSSIKLSAYGGRC